MTLDQLNMQLKKIIDGVSNIFIIDDAKNIVDKNSTLSDRIKQLENTEKAKNRVAADMMKKKDSKFTNATSYEKYSTQSVNNEIVQLLNYMKQRKTYESNIRTLKIKLEVENRTSILLIDSIKILKLNFDGQGKMELYFPKETQNFGKIFRFIILPVIRSLNNYFKNSEISISNKKDTTKTLSLNKSKNLYVSSKQITNKPFHYGQKLIFTNLKEGRFTIKDIKNEIK